MADRISYDRDSIQVEPELLHSFLTFGERSQPITFGGRTKELDLVSSVLEVSRESRTLANATYIYGAPGVGKSSLLRYLKDRLEDNSTTAVFVEGESLGKPPEIVEEFVLAHISKDRVGVADSTVRSHESPVDLKLHQQRETWKRHEPSALNMLASGLTVWSVIQQLLKPAKDHVFVLLIDEAQRVQADPGQIVNSIAVNLNSGRTGGLLVIPVFAGLFDTPSALDNAGLSRTSSPFSKLDALNFEDSRQVVKGFFDIREFGISDCLSSPDRSRIVDSLAVASEGWPRHLHHYIQGFARTLLSIVENEDVAAEIDLETVLDYGHNARIQYYQDRIRASAIGNYALAIAEAVSETSEPELVVAEIHGRASKYGISMTDAEERFNKAVRSGVLEPVDLGLQLLCRFPIPSFQTFFRCRGDVRETLLNLRASYKDRMRLLEI